MRAYTKTNNCVALKIWIDIINTPQVSFWVPFIRNFKNEAHSIIVTCRDSGNTIDLLKQQGIDYHVVGNSAGRGIIQKFWMFPHRLFKLFLFIRKVRCDVAVSQSSFYQPVAAYISGIPCLYTNDNEHARGNIFGFFFAKKVILPVALSKEPFISRWPLRNKISFYPSVKEAIYLSQQPEIFTLVQGKKNVIYFRPEPWSAQYYDGPLNFFDQVLISLSNKYNITVLPRDKSQIDHYKNEKFSNIKIAYTPLMLGDIISDCLLFIGAGGSMTRELAVLGVPVLSIYQSKLLCVDKYLADRGLMKTDPNINYDGIEKMIQSGNKEKDLASVEEGIESYRILTNEILHLKKQL